MFILFKISAESDIMSRNPSDNITQCDNISLNHYSLNWFDNQSFIGSINQSEFGVNLVNNSWDTNSIMTNNTFFNSF